jgi:hypothetical protein
VMDKVRGWPSMFSRDQRIGIMKSSFGVSE